MDLMCPQPLLTPPPTRAGKCPEVLALALFYSQARSRTRSHLHGRQTNRVHMNAV